MPYFVYRISPERRLTLVDTFIKFKDAKDFARGLRARQPADDQHKIRMMFADDAKKAQLLLADPRSSRPDGDD